MEKIYLDVNTGDSEEVGATNLFISVRAMAGGRGQVVVGYPGLPNITEWLHAGDTVLFQAPSGVFEVRVKTLNYERVSFYVTHLSRTPGIAAGFSAEDLGNSKFTTPELDRIRESIDRVRLALATDADIAREKVELLNRKLDEMAEASTRLGRKDWLNYAVGLISSVCVAAAFTPGMIKTVFLTINAEFEWLFTSATMLLE